MAIWDAFKELLGIHSPSTVFAESGGDIVLGIIEGISSKAEEVKTAIRNLATNLIEAITDKVSEFLQAGKDWISGLISGISTMRSSIVSTITNLISTLVTNVRTSYTIFYSAANYLITSVVDAFNAYLPFVIAAAQVIISNTISEIRSWWSNFRDAATNLWDGFINGVSNITNAVVSAARVLISAAIYEINSRWSEFKDKAAYLLNGFISGVQDNTYSVTSKIGDMMTSIKTKIMGFWNDIYHLGTDLVTQFKNGIGDMIYQATQQAYNLANAVWRIIRDALGLPNFQAIGAGVSQGLSDGIQQYSNKVVEATNGIGDNVVANLGTVVSRISDAIDSSMDMSPTIRPIVDLSNVVASGKKIDGLLAANRLSVSGGSIDQLSSITTSMKPATATQVSTQVNQPAAMSQISFVQNNYSPTALNRIDIYRQTQNQLSALKARI
jgi:phage-related protein